MQALQSRGLLAEAAALLLDSCPPLELTLWYGGHSQGRAGCEVWLALDAGCREVPAWLQGKPSLGGGSRGQSELAGLACRAEVL